MKNPETLNLQQPNLGEAPLWLGKTQTDKTDGQQNVNCLVATGERREQEVMSQLLPGCCLEPSVKRENVT